MARNALTDAFAFENPGSAFYGAIRGMGIDPNSSYLGGALKRRAGQLGTLLNLSTFGPGEQESQAIPFAQRFAQGLMQPQGGANDLMAPGAVQGLIDRFTNAPRDSEAYTVLNTGDIAKDYQAWQGMRDLQLMGANPLYGQARRGLDERTFADTAADFASGNLGMNETVLDRILGRQPQAANPPVSGPGFGVTPTPGQPPTAPRPTTPAPPSSPSPTPAPATPAPGAGGGPGSGPITSLRDLLDRFRADQRNWGTEGYRPSANVDIQLGNERFRYDPTQDQVRDWRNMSGTGRITHRGNFLGQLLYYLNLLQNQARSGGNAAIGLASGAGDQDILRIAMQRMGQNAVGNTGFRYDRTG